jgi:hypothetical protein
MMLTPESAVVGCDLHGARRQLLESTLAATPAQRLAWLEEVLEIAYRAGALGPRPPDRKS